MDLDAGTVETFERIFTAAVEPGRGAEIEYDLPAPKWQFLAYLCDTKGLLAHGSGNPHIEEFEPRQSNDVAEFGNRRAVYAASDALWAMYFAIVDRDGHVKSLMNACFRVVEEDGSRSEPYYFFSVNGDALPHKPWRRGTLYLLPRDTFEQQPPQTSRGALGEIQQWASLVSVRPLARLSVDPEDFPFLEQILPHDPATVRLRYERDPEGFPWLDD